MYRSPHFKCLFRKPGIDVMAGEMKKRELGMLTVRIALNTLLQSRKDYYTSPKQRKWVSTRLCYPDIFSKSNLAFSAEKQVGTSCEHSWGEPESQIRDSQIRVGQCPASAAHDLLFIISSVLGSLRVFLLLYEWNTCITRHVWRNDKWDGALYCYIKFLGDLKLQNIALFFFLRRILECICGKLVGKMKYGLLWHS